MELMKITKVNSTIELSIIYGILIWYSDKGARIKFQEFN